MSHFIPTMNTSIPPSSHDARAPSGPGTPHYRGLLWTSDRVDGENLRTNNSRKGQTSMPPVGYEPSFPESKRPQSHALDRAATGIGAYRNRRVIHFLWLHLVCVGKLINLLKPTGHVMHQQVLTFNNCTLCPHCICVLYLCENKQRLVPLIS